MAKQAYKPTSGSLCAASGVAADKFGSVYEVGYAQNPNIFGSDTINFNPSWFGMYLVKYDSAGNFIWLSKPITGYKSHFITYSVATDIAGDVYVAGEFSDTLIWGKYQIITGAGGNMFLAKINPSGNVIWLKQANSNGLGHSIAYSVSADNLGNEFITGSFSDTITIGSYILKTVRPSVFLARYDSSGNLVWAEQGLTSSSGTGYSVITGSNNIYITGIFNGTLSFGSQTVNGKSSVFLAKFDYSGNPIWLTSPDSANCTGCSVAMDNAGNIYVTGEFIDTIGFNKDTLKSDVGDVFVAKYSNAGNVIWAKQTINIAGSFYGASISIDNYNNIYISGSNWTIGVGVNPLKFLYDNDTLSVFSYNPGYASFVLKLDTSGRLQCGTLLGDRVAIYGAADPFGKGVYVVGSVSDSSFINPYSVYQTAWPGPSATIAKWHGCDNVTGINEVTSNTEQVKVYPNPSDGVFTFQAIGRWPLANSQIEVYNVLGQKIFQHSFSALRTTLDLSGQPAGIYLYRITSEKGEAIGSGKLIIK